MDAIDRLLAQVKQEYEENSPAPSQVVPNGPIEPISTYSYNIPTPHFNLEPIQLASDSEDPLVVELRAEYEQQERQAKLQQQQQLEQQRQAKIEQAKAWLKNLDPISQEGVWFEQLAEKYPSKLEAAIDYLGTMAE
jgi:hypothetical protein